MAKFILRIFVRALLVVTLLTIIVLTFSWLDEGKQFDRDGYRIYPSSSSPSSAYSQSRPQSVREPSERYKTSPGDHPIKKLINNANAEFDSVVNRQSKTLEEAVKEYERRYGIPPPPKFDIWWQFAKERKVVLVDEFDTIHHTLQPLWGLPPKVLRERVKEALGHDNGLIGCQIREGNVTYIEGGRRWMRDALRGMMVPFINNLPDMDLAFNIHDEPRIILPQEDLTRVLAEAELAKGVLRTVAKEGGLLDAYTHKEDIRDARGWTDVPETRFLSLPHQSTWSLSRSTCPPDSPSRSLEELQIVPDYNATSIIEPLGFISNTTASSDICLHPSLATTYGFFAGANTFRPSQDLVPVFSQSKLSSFQDILYPSPWYWADKVPYDEAEDKPWEEKTSAVYWRGATTGGYSRFGGWRRMHRQRFVSKVKSQNTIKVLGKKEGDDREDVEWVVSAENMKKFNSMFDVGFVEIGQADRGDVSAMKQVFHLTTKLGQGVALGWKYLLDMDGNAFSGRFYSFLRSRSAVVKMAVSREWHDEWVRPWVHYVPVSVQGQEWVETVRWLFDSEGGKRTEEGRKVAERSREWSGKAIRNEDLEVWFFRLLLEYARAVDDERLNLGFELKA